MKYHIGNAERMFEVRRTVREKVDRLSVMKAAKRWDRRAIFKTLEIAFESQRYVNI